MQEDIYNKLVDITKSIERLADAQERLADAQERLADAQEKKNMIEVWKEVHKSFSDDSDAIERTAQILRKLRD